MAMKLDRARVCLPIADRCVSHIFYTALGFSAFGDLADDALKRDRVRTGCLPGAIPDGL
jgi:predicted lactoylglutathione lyase